MAEAGTNTQSFENAISRPVLLDHATGSSCREADSVSQRNNFKRQKVNHHARQNDVTMLDSIVSNNSNVPQLSIEDTKAASWQTYLEGLTQITSNSSCRHNKSDHQCSRAQPPSDTDPTVIDLTADKENGSSNVNIVHNIRCSVAANSNASLNQLTFDQRRRMAYNQRLQVINGAAPSSLTQASKGPRPNGQLLEKKQATHKKIGPKKSGRISLWKKENMHYLYAKQAICSTPSVNGANTPASKSKVDSSTPLNTRHDSTFRNCQVDLKQPCRASQAGQVRLVRTMFVCDIRCL
jgi:hypothetical protein